MLSLTARDDEILDTLTLRVRILSLDQIRRTWWPGSVHGRQTALRRITQLEDEGLVHIFQLVAHPELTLCAPLLAWTPKRPDPDFHKVAYRASARWSQPPVQHTAVIATRQAGSHYGGWGGRYPRLTERTHDLHVAALYLQKCSEDPDTRKYWKSEEKLREERAGKKNSGRHHLPDAIITRPRRTVIEFGGAYKVEKLSSFHGYCKDIGLPYEIW